jgi:tetratricopeptide (TPR) repeat protein
MTNLYIRLDQLDKGVPLLNQSVEFRRKLGDQTGLAASLEVLGWVAYNGAHYVEAEAHWQEGHQLSRQIGDRRLIVWILSGLGWLSLFSRGDLVTVRAMAEEMQTIALDLNDPECNQRGQVLFGFLAGMTEDYFTCRQAFPSAANRHKFPYNRAWELIGLCLAACGLGDDQTAWQHLQEILELSHLHGWLANYAIALPFAAVLAARAEEPEHAVELLSLAYHHPLSPKGWLTQWPLLARLRVELESMLGPDAFETAWTQGKTLDLETTAEALLAKFRP